VVIQTTCDPETGVEENLFGERNGTREGLSSSNPTSSIGNYYPRKDKVSRGKQWREQIRTATRAEIKEFS
jgi:hypothetical protein